MRLKLAVTVGAAIALLMCFPGVARGADLVEVRDSKTGRILQVPCTILEETYKVVKVEIDEGGAKKPREIPLELVLVFPDGSRSIDHSPKPPVFSEALSLYKARNYEMAFAKFGESYGKEGGTVAWVKPYIRYYAGEAAFREAKYNRFDDSKWEWYSKAADQYSKLLAEAPNHRFAPDGKLGLALSYMRLRKFAEAATTVQSIIAAEDYPSLCRTQAKVWAARLAVEEGDAHKARAIAAKREGKEADYQAALAAATKSYDAAIAKIDELVASLEKTDAALAYLALLGKGYALQGKEDYSQAEVVFEKVGLLSPDEEVQAEAFNSRGLSLRSRAQPREALFSFLRVVILHFSIPSEHEKALYYAAISAREYFEGDTTRALELARMLLTRYPNGYWAKRLSKEWGLQPVKPEAPPEAGAEETAPEGGT
jgi:tetratricopeptide (TPR) repeat protein